MQKTQTSFDFGSDFGSRQPGPGETVIYRPYITLKNGTKLWARQFGKKAFRLVVPAAQA